MMTNYDLRERISHLYPTLSPQWHEMIARELELAKGSANPLVIWNALFMILLGHSNFSDLEEKQEASVSAEVTLPREIADYLLHSSFAINLLAWGQMHTVTLTKDAHTKFRPFRSNLKNTTEMLRLVPRALGFGGTKRTSAFSHLREAHKEAAEALAYAFLSAQGVSRDEAYQLVSSGFATGVTAARQEKRIASGRKILSGRFGRRFRSEE